MMSRADSTTADACRREAERVVAKRTKAQIVDYLANEMAREQREVRAIRAKQDLAERALAVLRTEADDLLQIKRAVDGLVKLRVAQANGELRDTRTLSMFPNLPKNTDGLEGADAQDPEAVLADIVDKSDAICVRLEEVAELEAYLDAEERADMLAALGMTEYQWMTARGRK